MLGVSPERRAIEDGCEAALQLVKTQQKGKIMEVNKQFGFVVVHQIQGQVQGVSGDVDDGAAALGFRIQEHTPVGSTSATDGIAVGIVYPKSIGPS